MVSKLYECPECEQTYDTKKEAKECCDTENEINTYFECDNAACDTLHTTHKEANECTGESTEEETTSKGETMKIDGKEVMTLDADGNLKKDNGISYISLIPIIIAVGAVIFFASQGINILAAVLLLFGVICLLGYASIQTIRPTRRGLIERFGKFYAYSEPGLVLLVPFIDRLVEINITEQMVDATSQEVITKDSLNAKVDAQVYFKVKSTQDDVKKSQYAVNDYNIQIVQLARTTLRAIIGEMTLTEANTSRVKLNNRLAEELRPETAKWGIDIVRAELKEISPPDDVQEKMNQVVRAEKEKVAAIDFATAAETKADGERRAMIKMADGNKQQQILEADGKAQAIKLVAKAEAERIQIVNTAAQKYFKGNAIQLKKLDTVRESLQNNAKILIPTGSNLVNVIGDAAGIVPIRESKQNKKNKE